MSALALLLSLVLEHFRPLLPGDDAGLLSQEPESLPSARRNEGPDRTARAESPDDMDAADHRAGLDADREAELDAELEAELARMADESPEPDPFDAAPPESPPLIDADLAARAAMQDDRAAFIAPAHPWFGPVASLVDWATPEAIDTADRPPMAWGGWWLVVLAPAVLLWIAQLMLATLGWLGAFGVLLLHVWVLWHGVLAGRLHRRLDRLFELVSARDDDADVRASAGVLVRRWVSRAEVSASGNGKATLTAGTIPSGAASGAATAAEAAAATASTAATEAAATAEGREIARLGLSLPVLDAYRDVFAPIFWYLLLPGASGPLMIWCARVAAARRGGVAANGLRMLDWLPIRLAAFGFALAGRFDDAVFGLRSSHAAASAAADRAGPDDPAAGQRLMLLPAASGSLGIDLLDETTRQWLKEASADVAAEYAEPELGKLAAVRSLLIRCAGIWAAVLLVVWLVS